MYTLNNTDYKSILEYYNAPIPKSSRLLKVNAENILANKLCRCIKKLDPTEEAKSVGICTKTILNRKGLTRGKFKCRGKNNSIIIKKTKNKKILQKYRNTRKLRNK
jgi:hypothetical protein